jgi:hypothetical protein
MIQEDQEEDNLMYENGTGQHTQSLQVVMA